MEFYLSKHLSHHLGYIYCTYLPLFLLFELIWANPQTDRAIATMIGVNVAVIFSRFASSRLMTSAGIPSVQVLPQVCLSFTQQIIPDLLGRHYMDKLFAKESIEDMKGFIASLKESFHQILEGNQWMETTTKANAIKKLDAINEHIAFPEYSSNDTQLLKFEEKVSWSIYF